jgi:myo-inositol 2-dehydrogenase/D-chiro-inositol 1-dehydrogenase
MTGAAVVRLAVVGAGRMGRVHLEALRRSSKVRAVAAADPSAAAREALAAAGLAVHAGVTELLESGGFDAAIVAAPSDRHVETVMALLEAGVPVLCEKPCGLDTGEAGRIAALAQTTGVPVQVGFFRRFVPALQAFRDRLRAGELGEVAQLATFQWDGEPPPAAYYTSSGGVFADMAIHDFDELRWLSGQELEEIAGMGASLQDTPTVAGDPGHVELVARLSGGTLATLSLGRRFGPGDALRVEAVGTRGVESCAFMWPPEDAEIFVDAVRRQAEAFAGAVRGGPVVGATPADAVAALAAAELARRSVPLTTGAVS